MAYKFKSEQVSKIKLNKLSDRKVVITPVANLEPVQCLGTIVKGFFA
jgi:NAD-dependent DNA ligase